MKTSIIVPNWNGIKFIKVCLDSVFASDGNDFEVIVVDNGSTDGSLALVRDEYSQVRLLRLGKNYGFARACNEGIHAAQGEYIVLLNNDVEVEDTWLRELVEGMDRHPECGMGTSKMVQYDNRKQIYNTGDLFKIWCSGGGRGSGELDEGQYEKEDYVFGACAGAGIYRRSLFEKIGVFDEDFFIFAEDVDINLRAQLVNERCIYLPQARVYHWGTATVGFHSNRHVFLFSRNDLFVLIKNYTLREFLSCFLLFVRIRLKEVIQFSLEGQGIPVFLSHVSFLWFFPGMVVKRCSEISRRKRALKDIPEIIKTPS